MFNGKVRELLFFRRAIGILKNHRSELDLLADALLRYETLDADDIKSIIEGDAKMVHKKLSANLKAKGLNFSGDNSKAKNGTEIVDEKKQGQDVLVHIDLK